MEIFGVLTGFIYVFLEAKQNKLLWPLGIITSGVYIWVFYDSAFYADMGLQVYYVLISIYGWYAWNQGHKNNNTNQSINNNVNVNDDVACEPNTKVSELGSISDCFRWLVMALTFLTFWSLPS